MVLFQIYLQIFSKGGAIIFPRIDIKRCEEEGGDLHAISRNFIGDDDTDTNEAKI